MDPELRSVIGRYTVVGIVLAAAVVWAVVFTTKNATRPEPAEVAEDGTMGTRSSREAERNTSAVPPPPPEAEAPKAPSNDRLYVDKMGVKRVNCRAACDFEAYCSLRDTAVCLAKSCDGDLRKANASDFKWRQAGTCADVAAAPCEESCWKKGECTGHHEDDMRCTDACLALVRQRPHETYAESRCAIESACQDIPLCAGAAR